MTGEAGVIKKGKRRGSISLQIMALFGMLSLILFSYLPMFGVVISFQNYTLSGGFFGSEFVGLKHFREFLVDPTFAMAAKNTIIISLLRLGVVFPAPILLSLIINELPYPRFKSGIQTISYFPYFIAYVVVAGLWLSILDVRGLVNNVLMSAGFIAKRIEFWTERQYYRPLILTVDIWKGVGWSTIIYTAAISGINAELYEAARVDGAGRLRQIWHITIPSIVGTIIVMFILQIGGMVRGNLDQSVLFGNQFTKSVSYIIEHYVLDLGFGTSRYSFASAVALLQGIISLFLVVGANLLSRRVSGRSIL